MDYNDNTEQDPKLQALSRIVNDLAKLFGTNLESLKPQSKIEEKHPLEEGSVEEKCICGKDGCSCKETPSSMFTDLIQKKKLEVE